MVLTDDRTFMKYRVPKNCETWVLFYYSFKDFATPRRPLLLKPLNNTPFTSVGIHLNDDLIPYKDLDFMNAHAPT